MSRKFVDTSALVKLYRAEPDSLVVQAAVSKSDIVILSRLTSLEYDSAFYGLVRSGQISLTDAIGYIGDYERDNASYEFIELTRAVLDLARDLLGKHGATVRLTPPDAIQLASGLVEHQKNPLSGFVTTDVVMRKLAALEGLTVFP